MQEQKEKTDNSIRFTGQTGGERGEGYITMGVYTGNLWKMAVREFGFRDYPLHKNGMACSMAASYSIPWEVLPTVLGAEFHTEEDGLHGVFTFKDEETMQAVLDAMKAQRKVNDAMDELGIKTYQNETLINTLRSVDDARDSLGGATWLVRAIQSNATLTYDYTDDEGDVWKGEIIEGEDLKDTAWRFAEAFDALGGDASDMRMEDEEE